MPVPGVERSMDSTAVASAPGRYQPVVIQRRHEVVVEQIVAQIMSGSLEPEALLPTENELAQQFAVSRTVIREAVRVLVGKGLVAVRHGSGMQVQPTDQWNYLDPLLLFEQIRAGHDETLLTELLELRRVVEVEVAALAAVRRTAQDLHVLQEMVARMRASLMIPRSIRAWTWSFTIPSSVRLATVCSPRRSVRQVRRWWLGA